jgi:predicted porin
MRFFRLVAGAVQMLDKPVCEIRHNGGVNAKAPGGCVDSQGVIAAFHPQAVTHFRGRRYSKHSCFKEGHTLKKQLLTTTAAIALAGAAAPALSQEASLDWGGYYQFHFGYVDAGGTAAVGEDVGGFDMFSDGEIHFMPSITLDNGLTVGAKVELEAQADTGSNIDHTFMTLSGDQLGTIQAGNLNGVGYNTSFVTPGVGSVGIDTGTMSQFIPLLNFPNAHTDLSGDNLKINYITPSFNGFTFGVEYTPSTQGGNSRDPGVIDRNIANTYDIWGVAANYSQSYGATDVTVHASYQTGEVEDGTPAANTDPEVLRVGASVGFSGLTVGANYETVDADTANNAGDIETWVIGASYDMAGPWTIGADYINGTFDQGTGVDQEDQAFRLGAARDLGPGVSFDVNYIMYEGDDKATAGTERDGNILVSTLTFKF